MALLVSYVSHTPVDDFGLPFATLKYSVTLAANIGTFMTVPGNAKTYKAVIKVNAETWVSVNQAAAQPAGITFAATSSELVTPYYYICREVKAGDLIYVVSPATCNVSVVLYALSTPN